MISADLSWHELLREPEKLALPAGQISSVTARKNLSPAKQCTHLFIHILQVPFQ